MARSLPVALSTEFNSTELQPFYAVELIFDSGTLNFWTGFGEIIANGETWSGAGQVLGISTSSEDTDLSANGITLSFSGLDSSFVSIALQENYRGRIAKLYIGALDSSGAAVSDLYQIFAGRMDTMTIQENGETATLTITVENVLIDLERPRIRLLTGEEQLQRYPDDASLENVATLQDRQVIWGRES
jgi:hypothetical protein